MTANSITTFQIGKNGVTPEVAAALDKLLEHHKHIRISTLKASGRTKDTIKTMAESLVSKLNCSCSYTIIGFTIALRKQASLKKK